MAYPRELHDRWLREYRAIKTGSERTDWVEQKVKECNVINAV